MARRDTVEASPVDPETRAAQAAVVGRVLAALRERPEEALPLPAMAELAGFSPFHFSRVFRRVTGVPPGQFRAALRMERAKRLLLSTDQSVTEVCFAVGYDGLGTFTSRFTELVGVSPGRLRRLPEAVAGVLPGLPDLVLYGASPDPGRDVTGRVLGAAPAGTLIFVGLFPGGIPQGRPLAGAMLTAPGAYRLPPAVDGRYQVMAAALPAVSDGPAGLVAGGPVLAGRAERPLEVWGGRPLGPADVALRPILATDPPVVVALPALLLDALATDRARG